MKNNIFEMNMFNGGSISFTYKSIIVCNSTIKEAILNNQVELEVTEPFIIITNNKFTDEQIEVVEDASIEDCLNLYKFKPSFGGIFI